MHLSSYLGLLETGCATLANSYRQVAEGHSEEADVRRICQQFAGQCDHHEEQLQPFTERYGSHPSGEPERGPTEGCSCSFERADMAMRWTARSEEGTCLLQMSSS
jgi:hypothetical protein